MKNNQKIISLFFTFIVVITSINAQNQYLFLNPEGHKSQIRDVVVSNDGKYAVTAGFDKTIKKWNRETGFVELEFRGNIGKGSEGMIYYLAISPDNKYLAAQGWFGANDESEPLGDVRIYDFETGKMIFVLHELKSSPTGLGFSNDSKFIIAADNNSTIYKWELNTQKVVAQYLFHSSEYGKSLSFIKVKNDKILSVDELGKLCLWDINNPKKPIAKDLESFNEGLKVDALAISSQNEYAAVFDNYIVIFNEKLKAYFMIENMQDPGFIKFSPSGNRLITGSVGKEITDTLQEGYINKCYLYEKQPNGDWAELAVYDYFNNSVLAGEFLDENTITLAGGENDEIHIIQLQKDSTFNILKTMLGKGQPFYSVALNGKKMTYSTVQNGAIGSSPFTNEMDLFAKEIYNFIPSDLIFNQPLLEYKNLNLWSYNDNGGSVTVNPNLLIRNNKTVIDTIKREFWNGSRHNVFSFLSDGNIVSAGSQGVMESYTKNGVLLNSFVGHEGDIWGMSLSADSTKLITCSSDQTIRVWSLEKVGLPNPNPPLESVWETWERNVGKNNIFEKIYTQHNIVDKAKERSYQAWEYVIKYMDKIGYKTDFLQTKLAEFKSTEIYPIASIFISKDNEWIIWNEDGYFSASKKGGKYVGYHVNQGKDLEAKYYPFEQFDLKFNRPDIILKDLALGDEKIRSFYYKAYLKRLKKMNLTESQLSGELHLPQIQIKETLLSDEKKSVLLKISALDTKYTLDRVNIYLNDVPIFGHRGINLKEKLIKQYESEIKIELANGQNKIQVSVLNDKGVESLFETKMIYSNTTEEKPNLYIVTIGTSNYLDSRFNLNYASKDALDVEKLFEKDLIYNQIFHKVLLDKDVTKNSILAVKDFLVNANRNDVVLIFIAGHGLLDENFDYYYATYDIDFNNPAEKGIIYSELENLLDGLKALKKLLFMDTCHSGEVDKDDVEKSKKQETVVEDVTFRAAGVGIRTKTIEGEANTSELVKELFTDLRRGTGATIISSAGGVEYAMESDQWKNGLFTYCLLHGITDKTADLNQDGTIMLSELQEYIQNEVSKLSNGKQKPTSRLENISLDYPIWK